jgi:NAD(P)-dependent dehydrogenase (short-subunit alcohol dehydrogenase family)
MPKTAIVTGASRGIGRAIALRLARDGMQVVLAARSPDLLEALAGEISGLAVACDLREPASAQRVVDAAVARFGAIDILVNNAGATKRGDFLALSEEDWSDGFALKFFGAVRLARLAWPHLARASGSLVNIAGVGGRTPGPQFAIGGSVNAALLSFTKALADLGVRDGVQVNAVNPGFIRTGRLARRMAAENVTAADLTREANIRRIGEPEDVASLVAYLVSPEGGYLHGSLIDLDGGQTKTL